MALSLGDFPFTLPKERGSTWEAQLLNLSWWIIAFRSSEIVAGAGVSSFLG
jgi:hypothetical protein